MDRRRVVEVLKRAGALLGGAVLIAGGAAAGLNPKELRKLYGRRPRGPEGSDETRTLF